METLYVTGLARANSLPEPARGEALKILVAEGRKKYPTIDAVAEGVTTFENILRPVLEENRRLWQGPEKKLACRSEYFKAAAKEVGEKTEGILSLEWTLYYNSLPRTFDLLAAIEFNTAFTRWHGRIFYGLLTLALILAMVTLGYVWLIDGDMEKALKTWAFGLWMFGILFFFMSPFMVNLGSLSTEKGERKKLVEKVSAQARLLDELIRNYAQ